MDILKTLGQSRLYNLHSHTEFCDGRAQMQVFAAEAVYQGFTHYGFSPHSPVPDNLDSPCNMARRTVDAYLAEADILKQKYASSGTTFLTSMEIDYLGHHWGPAHDYFQTLPLDYRIGSVHFIASPEGKLIDIDGNSERFARNMHLHFHDDIRYVVEQYFSRSIELVRHGGFDIIGHFDKIGQNASSYAPGVEDQDWYTALADQLIQAIADAGIIAELNTKAFRDHSRFFPCRRNLRKAISLGIPFVVNSDAHVPALINASRDEAFALIKECTL